MDPSNCRTIAALALAASTIATPAAALGVAPAGVLDAASAVEANRPRIVERVVGSHGAAMIAHGVSLDALRAALWALPADRLLAASLADSAEEVNTIVALAHARDAQPKDGPGSGPGSWIGYTGGGNVASGNGSAVAAGKSNVASGMNAFVGAGTFNGATGSASFVGGGTSNVASGTSALVLGGFDNRATVIDATVVSGAGNRATGARSLVVGGGYNLASGQWSMVGGGGRQTGSGAAGANPEDNVAAGNWSVVAGGRGNRASGLGSTLGGGFGNAAVGSFSTVAGGGGIGNCSLSTFNRPCLNAALDSAAAVGGGAANLATAVWATVGGGYVNAAQGIGSTVSGGLGNVASGDNSMVPGGVLNAAGGAASFAAGWYANADQNQCALFGLWVTQTIFNCLGASNMLRIGANHGFSVDYQSQRADGGGTRWVAITDLFSGQTIATWSGAQLTDAGVWVNASSSRERKTDFEPVDPGDVLRRVADIPISTWRYKEGEGGIRHIGPMAEDFWNAFGIGYGAHTIADLDARGVALAAIQGLKHELDERNGEVAALRQRLDARDVTIDLMQRRLDVLEHALRDAAARAASIVSAATPE